MDGGWEYFGGCGLSQQDSQQLIAEFKETMPFVVNSPIKVVQIFNAINAPCNTRQNFIT
jgi:hypothetical protein